MQLIVRDMVTEDVQYVAPIGREYYDEAPLKVLTYSGEMTDHNLRVVVLDRKRYFCQVAIEETESGREYIGLLLAQRITPFFSTDQMAQDVMFLVRKPYRTRYPQAALMLLKGYRQWAFDQGMKLANLGTISGIETERTGEFFQRLGYTKLGTFHALELGHGRPT